jgi:hypothetical protein
MEINYNLNNVKLSILGANVAQKSSSIILPMLKMEQNMFAKYAVQGASVFATGWLAGLTDKKAKYPIWLGGSIVIGLEVVSDVLTNIFKIPPQNFSVSRYGYVSPNEDAPSSAEQYPNVNLGYNFGTPAKEYEASNDSNDSNNINIQALLEGLFFRNSAS